VEVPHSTVANKLTGIRSRRMARPPPAKWAPCSTARTTGELVRLRDEEDVAWNDAALLPGGGLVVVGEFGRILVSPDGGSTWLTPEVPVSSSLMAVAFRNGKRRGRGPGGVVLSTDGGGPGNGKKDSHPLLDVAWDEPNSAGWGWVPSAPG
jgi:hypothetical protein